MKNRKVFAYIRYSSAEQANGDSENRQIRLLKDWCKRNDYDFERITILVDRGLSAYKGHHISKGKLGAFWNSLTTGELVPSNTALLVENFDRLSREGGLKALKVLTLVEENCFWLETLSDGRVYNNETVRDLSTLLSAQVSTARSNDESKEKARRVGGAWVIKRAQIGQKIFTRKCPFWISFDGDVKKFILIEDRVSIVREVFRHYVGGHGTAWITCWLNEKKITPWGRKRTGLRKEDDFSHKKKYDHAPADRWLNSYVKKILTNIATYGAIQLHTTQGRDKRSPIGDAIQSYYPAAISKETFDLAQLIRTQRYRKTGRSSKGCGNLFPMLCKCGFCGSGMHYVTKNSVKGEVYLVCSNSRYKGGCRYISFPYRLFETSFLRHVRKIPFSAFEDGKQRLLDLRAVQLNREASLNDIDKQIEGLIDLQTELRRQGVDESGNVSRRLVKLHKSKSVLTLDVSQIANEMAALQGFDANSKTVSSLLEDPNLQIYLNDSEKRHHLRDAIAKMVRKIDIFPAYNLKPHLRHTRHFVVHFVDGTTQKCLGAGDSHMTYSKTGEHEASWSKNFGHEYHALLPSLSGIDSGKTTLPIKQMS